MDINRAKEIASSPGIADVTFFGQQVYIENVNVNSETASIHLMDQPHISREIPISYLKEH